jgi:hypothetical protein
MARMSATHTRARPGTQPPPGYPAGRTARVLAAEKRIGYVAHVLDDLVAVPGTRSRVGLDPIIGLVPFLGDIVTSLVAMWIVVEAARFKVPGIVLARMIINASVDFLIGLIPFLGDLFDLVYKANTKNLELFHRHAVDPGASTTGSSAFVFGVILVFVGVFWVGLTLLARLLSIVIG